MAERLLSEELLDSYRELASPEDPHFVRNYLRTFLEGVPAFVAGIDAAIRAGKPDDLARSAHGLKSSCLNVGAEPIVERAARLESLGKSGSMEGAAAIASEITGLCRKLADEIHALPEFLTEN